MSVQHRTDKEIQSQRAKRDRRYANSIGLGYCQLTRRGRMCPDRTVRVIQGVGLSIGICQHHSDLLVAILEDSKGVRQRASA